MGAIAGWIAASRRAPEAEALTGMLEALAHRGGGESMRALVENGRSHRLVLGNRAHDPRAGLTLAFDGSIDNRDELRRALELRSYVFNSKDDDELVLRAYQHWDKDVVTRLRGRFALALWDARKERLLRKLLIDRQVGERVGAAARETVRARFAPDKALARLEEVYIEAGLSLQGAAHGSHRRLDSGIAPSA